jgi:uncharacterized membrane protein
MREFIFIFMIGIFIITLGIHEVDLSFNMKGDCIDTSIGGMVKNSVQMHMQGLFEIIIGEILVMLGVVGILPKDDKK